MATILVATMNRSEQTAETEFPELAKGWTRTRLGDIAEVVGGGTPSTKDPTNFAAPGNGTAWLTPADLSGFRGTHIERGSRDLSPTGLRFSSARVVPAGTVLMSSRAPIGYVAIARGQVATNQGFKSFICRDGVIPEFVFYWLKFIEPMLQELGSGSTFAEISGTRAKEIPFLLPPTLEQRRIVERLAPLHKRLRSCTDRLERVPKILWRLRQMVLAAACSGQLTAVWRNSRTVTESASALLQRLASEREAHWRRRNPNRHYRPAAAVADEELPRIPAAWKWTNFDHCAWEITVGHVGPMKQRYVERGIPFLRSQNVRPLHFVPDGLVAIDADFHAALRKSALQGGEILITRTGANTGDCCVYPGDRGEANCADLVVTRPLSGLIPAYAAIYVSSPEGQARIGLRETGMAQPHFNIGAMRVKPFPLPPVDEQREIVRRVEALFAAVDQVEAQLRAALARAEWLPRAILARAFRGELVPTEADLAAQEGRTFESAEELLVRIHEGQAPIGSEREHRRRPRP